jgi:hypothetical protein
MTSEISGIGGEIIQTYQHSSCLSFLALIESFLILYLLNYICNNSNQLNCNIRHRIMKAIYLILSLFVLHKH